MAFVSCSKHNADIAAAIEAAEDYTDQAVSKIVDSDNQTLSVQGKNLAISGGNSVALPLPDLATESTAGIAEIATQAETNAGVDDTRIVTPLKLKGAVSAIATEIGSNPSFAESIIRNNVLTFDNTTHMLQADVNGVKSNLIDLSSLITNIEAETVDWDQVNYTLTIKDSSGTVHNIDLSSLIPISYANSVTGSGTTGAPTQLVGDLSNPGVYKYYGTGADGAKGWVDLASAVPYATEQKWGKVKLASEAMIDTALDGITLPHIEKDSVVTAPGLHYAFEKMLVNATEDSWGFGQIATVLEAQAGVDDTAYITPFKLKKVIDAKIIPVSDTQTGVVTNEALQELGGVDKLINGVRIGRGGNNTTVVSNTNTSLGRNCLGALTQGAKNTGIGAQALAGLGIGDGNTAVGSYALASVTEGSGNTAVGDWALAFNTASDNTASGRYSLYSNSTGTYNAASGGASLFSNTTGARNSAHGFNALAANTVGSRNTASGADALARNRTGSSNTAFGVNALAENVAGNSSVALGEEALRYATGNNNFALGYVSGADGLVNLTTESNKGVLGNNATDTIYAKVSLTVLSDERDKVVHARGVPLGLDFIKGVASNALITYQFKEYRGDVDSTDRIRYGVSAQKVLEVEGASPVIIDATDSDKLRYNESDMVAALINSVGELSAIVDDLSAEIKQLKGE